MATRPPFTTNNRMELLAVEAYLKPGLPDSTYAEPGQTIM